MLDLYRPINKYLIYPLYYWKNSDTRLKRLAALEKSQYFSKNELESLQQERLQKIVSYAYEHTRYYRRIMRERDLTPADIQTLQDVQKLPLLTKSIIQNNLPEMLSNQFDKKDLVKDSSGGSTGEPTIYYKDIERHTLRRADQIRHDRWSGWDIGKRKALIWGAQRDLTAARSFRENILATYLERQWELDAFEMSDCEMFDYARKLERIRPSMILGYANALYLFASFLQRKIPNHTIKCDGVVSSAETLSETKREFIESVFKCKVLNRYGSREVGLIASECQQQQGLHINAENLLLELVDQTGKSVEEGSGDIVVTDFWNFGMPIIRYQLGDVGTRSTDACDCGRGLPLLGAVEGRCSDFLVNRQGHKIHGEYFTHLFYELPQVKQFRLVQESLDQVNLTVVENIRQLNTDYLNEVVKKTKAMLGEDVKINLSVVDSIPTTKTGKLLFTQSKVSG